MAVEITVVMRFEDYVRLPDEDSLRSALEAEYDCTVIDYEEEEI